MKYLIIIILLTFERANCQYDFLIDSLKLKSFSKAKMIDGRFLIKKKSTGLYYKFSNHRYSIYYYPSQGANCGYFILAGKKFSLESAFEFNLGCDLDYGSFLVYEMTISPKTYLIITAINSGSGTSTRNVFCNLFNISDVTNIKYYPLQSVYGSGACFGDFNNDGAIDFVKISKSRENSNDNIFDASLYSYESSQDKFREAHKSIVFKREYTDDSFKATIVSRNW